MQVDSAKKKLIISFLLSFVLLVTCVVGVSYAWLTRNVTITASNPNFQVLAPDAVVKGYKVYQYDAETNTVVEATVATRAGVNGEIKYYKMTQYDVIFTERNVYNSLLFEITLEDVTAGAMKVDAYCDAEHDKVSLDEKHISDIISLKACTLSQITNNSSIKNPTTAEGRMLLFDTATKYFKNTYSPAEGKTFCNTSGTGKSTAIYFNLNVAASDIYKDNGADCVTIYLLMDYSQKLIEKNFGTLSGADLTNNKPIDFYNDITTIYFSNPKKTSTGDK